MLTLVYIIISNSDFKLVKASIMPSEELTGKAFPVRNDAKFAKP